MEIKLFGDKMVGANTIEGLASRIFKCAVIGANQVKRAAEAPIPRAAWLSIVFEHVFFYLALAKRHAWTHLPAEKQESLTNRVGDVLITAAVDYVFEDGGAEANASRVEDLKIELGARMQEYGNFPIMVQEAESEKPKGTALWAFCHKVAALAGRPKDLVCVMTTHAHIHDSMMVIGMGAPEWTGPSL